MKLWKPRIERSAAFLFPVPEPYPQRRMADCDYRRGLLARNAAVITMRSDCDERRQPFEHDDFARYRTRARNDATSAHSCAGTPLAPSLARESRSECHEPRCES